MSSAGCTSPNSRRKIAGYYSTGPSPLVGMWLPADLEELINGSIHMTQISATLEPLVQDSSIVATAVMA